MYNFFLASDLPSSPSVLKSNTYQVLTSYGALIKASDTYSYIRTDGLRTCVAFALINPHDSSTLLVHFICLNQVKDVASLVKEFMENTTLSDKGLIMVIAGGREFFHESVDMCDFLVNYAKELSKKILIKLRVMAPVVAEENETLSVEINLNTGASTIAMTASDVDTGDYPINPLPPVQFTNLIRAEIKEDECKQAVAMGVTM